MQRTSDPLRRLTPGPWRPSPPTDPAAGPDEPPAPAAARHASRGGAPRGNGVVGAAPEAEPGVAAALGLPLPVVVAVAALAVGAGGWWLWQGGRDDPATVVAAPAATVVATTARPTAPAVDVAGVAAPPGAEPPPSATQSATVHVAGAVGTPGIVVVAPGARVVDAVAAAGGLADDADTAAINLARPVSDGEMILVPVPGQPVPPVAGAVPPGATVPGGTGAGAGPVDINRATAAQLDELPGIGPVLAERIVSWREDAGPFASVDDLTAVPGIGPATLEELRESATV